MAEQYNRAFKGVWISKEIWLAKDLGWSEKLLLVEIDSLDGEQGCFASNEYLANFFGLSKDRISKMVSALKKKGYISVQVIYKEGTKEVDKRIIRVIRQPYPIGENNHTPSYKHQEGIGENNYTPIGENAEDNNTVINNTKNNTSNKDKDRPSSVGPSLIDNNFKSIQDIYHQLIGGTNFKDDQKISEALEFYEPALILEAIKVGADKRAKSFQYILGILDNWRKELGVTTYQDWQLKIQQRGGNRSGGNQQGNSRDSGAEYDGLSL